MTLLLTFTVLTTWSPGWLSPELNRTLMLLDPSGFRWLIETFLKVDRGVDFYNTSPLRPDVGFVLSRAGVLRGRAGRRVRGRRELRPPLPHGSLRFAHQAAVPPPQGPAVAKPASGMPLGT